MPEPSASNSFLEQTVSLMSSTASYMRLPAIASTVCPDTSASPAQCLNGCAVNRADWFRGQVGNFLIGLGAVLALNQLTVVAFVGSRRGFDSPALFQAKVARPPSVPFCLTCP
jgi:hypothetical protein